ncbi:MAG: transcriptional repressor [Proteobacteria bacterium]|nr:transcriptional repressor [Pseudomonadota bacterium]MBW3616993.1 transcriptional repressor [Pseudomonadota bacterium]
MSKGACGHEGEAAGLAGRALDAALSEAGVRVAAADERLTDSRRRVLELLLEAGGPVKAYDLIAAYGQGGAKPPTVYRALEFLERLGFAHRLESLNAYVACPRSGEVHAAAFLICQCCGATAEIEPEVSAGVEVAAEAHGFELRGLTLEARGLCGACR